MVWQTAVQYHLVHALALVLIAILCRLMLCPRFNILGRERP